MSRGGGEGGEKVGSKWLNNSTRQSFSKLQVMVGTTNSDFANSPHTSDLDVSQWLLDMTTSK